MADSFKKTLLETMYTAVSAIESFKDIRYYDGSVVDPETEKGLLKSPACFIGYSGRTQTSDGSSTAYQLSVYLVAVCKDSTVPVDALDELSDEVQAAIDDRRIDGAAFRFVSESVVNQNPNVMVLVQSYVFNRFSYEKYLEEE